VNPNCATLNEEEIENHIEYVLEIEKLAMEPETTTLEEEASRHVFY